MALRNISLAGHLSIAPMLMPVTVLPSQLMYWNAPLFCGKVASWAWSIYLKGTPPWAWDWRVSPLFADNSTFRQIPPGIILIHSFDALRDEGELYAQRLLNVSKLY